MARKGQASIQDSLENNEEFEAYFHTHINRLICMEVYSDFCGPCLATANAVRKGKIEIGEDRITMAKALSDNIDALARFRNKSEPVFLFILKGKLVRAMFGTNGIELCRIIEEELVLMQREFDTGVERPKQEINEVLPEEAARIEEDRVVEERLEEENTRLRVMTLAARKRRVCERLARHVRKLNYIIFFPHCHQAHYDLYEKWDIINISVAAKETMQITEDVIKEVMYMSDVELNEACLYALLKGEALIVLFKMGESDHRDFVKLMRYALYEEIPVPKEDVPPEKQVPPIPAYERYASISPTAREVRRSRYEAKLQKLREEKEERDRLAAEQARLAREAEEERLRVEKQRQEEERMARIQAGLPAEPEPEVTGEEVDGEEPNNKIEAGDDVADDEGEVVQEQIKDEEEVFHSDVSVEDEEYIPPGGLFVPGLYSPPNDLAKANGLAFFFPKIVQEHAPIESEHLPPHALVMFPVEKRDEVKEIIEQFPDEVINTGIFVGDDPATAEHIAFTIKQYNKMQRRIKYKDRLALMVSRKRSLPLLQLAGLNPCYISSDVATGERDCLVMFPVGYGDEYEEIESEEELETNAEPAQENQDVIHEEVVGEENKEANKENEDDDNDEG
ncbi:hypothetical protein ACJJTC_010648 [Scirpophaga incertulas]